VKKKRGEKLSRRWCRRGDGDEPTTTARQGRRLLERRGGEKAARRTTVAPR
jgi:hypothetical protein